MTSFLQNYVEACSQSNNKAINKTKNILEISDDLMSIFINNLK